MKVGYILRKFPVLSETFVLNEMLELEKLGIDISIFSIERPNDSRFHHDLSKLKAEVHFLPGWKKLFPYAKQAKKKFGKGYIEARNYLLRHFSRDLLIRFLQGCYVALKFDERQIEHLHAHFATRATSVAFFTSKLLGKPYSFTAHAVDIFKETVCKKALSKKIEHARHVVTVSDFNKHYLSSLNPSFGNKIIKIHNGIDFEKFKPLQEITDKAKTGPFIFLCVARFVEKKGHNVLLGACALLKKEQEDFECWMVGKGELEEEIRASISSKGLERHVKILGPHTHDEVLERYRQANVYILPCIEAGNGNKDGLPVSIVEALACGLPIITTPMTGNPEAVFNGVNGFLVPCNDASATARAMGDLINDPVLYAKMRKNARSSIEPLFNKDQTVKTLAALFQGKAE